ncbi:DUF559 domain-containing protein [Microbacterium betulae]|uniref:DUF559 domain-containing protein n=1 Tax=Microbacterium betulae TaxID=2981139 RepID=A0AA97FGN3_9MICO|nr:DUF559 domain-containing protein [Microbacterium sp. AB]WOF22323.1 DUF559 domain-containing protein [Microbacterium sp. AB]
MRTPRPVPDKLGTVFSIAEARAHGLSRSRMLAADLERPFHGVRKRRGVDVNPDPAGVAGREPLREEVERVDALRRLHAYATVMPDHAFAVGPTAALLWAAPLPLGHHDVLHIGVLHPRTPIRRPGIRGVQVQPHLASVVRGETFAATDPASTWASLGPLLGMPDLVAVADFFLRVPRIPGTARLERAPLATRQELEDALSAGRRHGAAMLRQALALARTGSASRPESIVRLLLIDDGLPEPALDSDIFDPTGAFVACGDLVYPEFRVIVEYEGDGHRERRQFERDIERIQRLSEWGWAVIRLTSRHVFATPDECVRRVRTALRRAGAPFA